MKGLIVEICSGKKDRLTLLNYFFVKNEGDTITLTNYNIFAFIK